MSRGKANRRGLRVLVATDGSPTARGAIATVRALPWPTSARVRAVVVSDPAGLAGSVATGAVNRSRVPVLVVR